MVLVELVSPIRNQCNPPDSKASHGGRNGSWSISTVVMTLGMLIPVVIPTSGALHDVDRA